MVLQRRDKRRYLLVYGNIKIFSDNFYPSDKLEDNSLYASNYQGDNTKNRFNTKLDKNQNTNILIPY